MVPEFLIDVRMDTIFILGEEVNQDRKCDDGGTEAEANIRAA